MHKPAKYLPLLCAGLLAGSVTPGAAQSALQTLQQEITRQQEQLKQQEQRLLELEKQLQDAIQREQKTEPQPTIPAPEQEPKEAASKVASQPEASPPQVLRESGDPYKLFADHDFPKSVPFFGSDWRFSYGGYVKLDLITDFDGTGDPYQFVTATIPVPGAANSPQPGGYTKVHVKESRFNFEVRNTSENAPFTKVFFEMDFFDESSYAPRLRHAYLQYGNLIVGQTWTTLTEMRSLPFLIDFAYGDALYGGRTPQIRWQQPLGEKFSWAVGLESWNDGAIENPSMLSGKARSWAPLLASRGTYDFGRGVFTFGGSLAQLRWDGDAGVSDSSTLQWAAVVAGRVYLDGKRRHYFALGGSYGHGSAGNIISLAEGGVPGAVLQPDGSLENLPAWNIAPALHLQLTDKLSSNLAWAWSEVQSSVYRLPDDMEGGGATHVNLIYDITPRFRVGGEYMYGTRRNVSGAEGHANRMQFMSMYTF